MVYLNDCEYTQAHSCLDGTTDDQNAAVTAWCLVSVCIYCTLDYDAERPNRRLVCTLIRHFLFAIPSKIRPLEDALYHLSTRGFLCAVLLPGSSTRKARRARSEVIGGFVRRGRRAMMSAESAGTVRWGSLN